MREYFVNADFDLTLGAPVDSGGLGGKPVPEDPTDKAHLREMPWHFLFAAQPGESLLAHFPLPEGFRGYIEAKGLRLPVTVPHPAFTPEAEFVPFGWNAQALALASRYARPPQAPELTSVKLANARVFALELERKWFPESCEGRVFGDINTLAQFLANRSVAEAWVAKGDHGYAGTANRRLAGGPLPEADSLRIKPLFAGNGRIVLEPWHERSADMAMLFRVSPQGGVEDFRGHVLRNSRDGAFLGAEVSPDRMPPAPWTDSLREQAARLALALSGIGYFGPVGVDAYVHGPPQAPRLRPLVDINARLSMAMPAHGLASRLPGRFIRWSWQKPRKLRMPPSYAELEERLGPAAYAEGKGEGILAVSPLLREDGAGSKPKRVGFALVAGDEARLESLQSVFDTVLGRSS